MKKWQVINGNNIDILKTYEDNTFDSIVTDPPYGIAFLGKDWDNDTGAMETWEECFRVLKPGGHILAFSAARTYHHLATNIEMAGFEIRDQLMWLYGSGFPKAQDIGKAIDKREGKKDPNYGSNKHSGIVTEGEGRKDYRCSVCNKTIGSWVKDCKEEDCGQKYNYQTDLAQQWAGWKTALKPAHEPIVMARKPFKGSAIDNVLEHGTGALNIDASRVTFSENDDPRIGKGYEHQASAQVMPGQSKKGLGHQQNLYPNDTGRFPSNVIMDEEAGAILDKQAPKTGNASSSKRTKTGMTGTGASLQWHKSAGESNGISDGLSGASKFFYCPKVSRSERHVGFDTSNIPTNPSGMYEQDENGKMGKRYEARVEGPRTGNNHPTVKPVELMKYLVRLVTPTGGKVLDPFNGSGSTGMACVELDYEYVGCELDPEYVEIANNRISAWEKKFDTPANNLFEDT